MATLCLLILALAVSVAISVSWGYWLIRALLFLALSLPAVAAPHKTTVQALHKQPVGTEVRVHGRVADITDEGKVIVYTLCDDSRKHCIAVVYHKDVVGVQPHVGDTVTFIGKRVQ